MRRKSLYGSGNLFKVTASKIKLDIEYNDGWQHTPVIGNPFSVNSNEAQKLTKSLLKNRLKKHKKYGIK